MGFYIVRNDSKFTTRTKQEQNEYLELEKQLSNKEPADLHLVTPNEEIFALLRQKDFDNSKIVEGVVVNHEGVELFGKEKIMYVAMQYALFHKLLKGLFTRDEEIKQYTIADEARRKVLLSRMPAIKNVREFFGDKSLGKDKIDNFVPVELITLDRVHTQFKMAINTVEFKMGNGKAKVLQQPIVSFYKDYARVALIMDKVRATGSCPKGGSKNPIIISEDTIKSFENYDPNFIEKVLSPIIREYNAEQKTSEYGVLIGDYNKNDK